MKLCMQTIMVFESQKLWVINYGCTDIISCDSFILSTNHPFAFGGGLERWLWILKSIIDKLCKLSSCEIILRYLYETYFLQECYTEISQCVFILLEAIIPKK